MPEFYDVVVVGAGHGGAQAAAVLRQHKYEGTVALVGDEPELPYERPPLSKEYLAGDKTFDRLLIRPDTFWSERQVTLALGDRVTAVHPEHHEIETDTGRTIGYGRLVWATGGVPRRLTCPGSDLAGVHIMRTRADADRVAGELDYVKTVAVVGGGNIGLEAAAVLTKLGKKVVLLEAFDRVLARVAGEALSRFLEDEHRAHGVDLRLGATLDHIVGADRVGGIRLAGGEVIECQMVVVGIGIEPAVGALLDAGASGGNGVDVDSRGRTSLPDVFAVGDCARHRNPYVDGAPIRLESVQNANDQATVVAKTIAGLETTYDAVPWFWSHQYDIKLQTVGLSTGHDTAVLRGDPRTRSFSVVYLRDGIVIALDCVNAVKDYVQGRRLVMNRARVDPQQLTDVTTALSDVLVTL